MGSKSFVFVIILGVLTLLYFMVSVVRDFNNASVVKSSSLVSAKDSVVAASIDQAMLQDSIMLSTIEEQQVIIDDLGLRLDNLTYKFNSLSKNTCTCEYEAR